MIWFLLFDIMDSHSGRKKNSAVPIMLTILVLLLLLALVPPLHAQVAVVQSPVPKFRDFLASGAPNVSGCVYTFVTSTSTPQATYTDATGVTPNSNPVQLDANGEASIWISANVYRIQVWTFGGGSPLSSNCGGGTQRYQVDGVSDKGLISGAGGALQLVPGGHANQTVVGPITADQFTGPATQLFSSFTIPGRSETYNVPTSGTTGGNVLVNPSGSGGTSNTLDCTLAGITCKRTAQFYFRGAQCNSATAGVGWDTLPTASGPTALCNAGTNVVKGVMGMPAAITHIQSNTGTNSATTTVTTTYPTAIIGGTGDYMILSVAFNGTTTISGCTDGTNAFAQMKHSANGALSVDIWANANPTTKPLGTVLTCTFVGAATSAMKWHEYFSPNAISSDVTASATGTSTTASTGTTASTAQATELIFAAMGDLAAPTATVATSGFTDHTVLNNSTTVQVDDAGFIQQTIGTQSATFTLGSSVAWAGAVATFKSTNAVIATAQQSIVLPAFFNASQAVNGILKWVVTQPPTGTGTAVLGLSTVCTADGASDDPAFNAETVSTAAITTTAANLPTTTTLSNLAIGTCAAGQTMHFMLRRGRYTVGDNYEGFIGVIGAQLQVGVTQ